MRLLRSEGEAGGRGFSGVWMSEWQTLRVFFFAAFLLHLTSPLCSQCSPLLRIAVQELRFVCRRQAGSTMAADWHSASLLLAGWRLPDIYKLLFFFLALSLLLSWGRWLLPLPPTQKRTHTHTQAHIRAMILCFDTLTGCFKACLVLENLLGHQVLGVFQSHDLQQ